MEASQIKRNVLKAKSNIDKKRRKCLLNPDKIRYIADRLTIRWQSSGPTEKWRVRKNSDFQIKRDESCSKGIKLSGWLRVFLSEKKAAAITSFMAPAVEILYLFAGRNKVATYYFRWPAASYQLSIHTNQCRIWDSNPFCVAHHLIMLDEEKL